MVTNSQSAMIQVAPVQPSTSTGIPSAQPIAWGTQTLDHLGPRSSHLRLNPRNYGDQPMVMLSTCRAFNKKICEIMQDRSLCCPLVLKLL